jgi:hypothetical protein
LSYIATTPATIFLQANPNAVQPNAAGSTTNQSNLTATVRDAVGNPVTNQTVNFTALLDGSNGIVSPGASTTDSNGIATVQFIPGALATAANGVVVQAAVQNTAVLATTTLTVNGAALFISIGLSNEIIVVDTNTYAKSFSVYVTDANGAPAGSRAVTLSVYPPDFYKGTLSYFDGGAGAAWYYSPKSPTKCANEDSNRNGILETGEDINTDGRLTPGLPVVLTPAILTTDANGYATFTMNYGKNYAYWLDTEVTAKATVNGTESSKSIKYSLQMLAADATNKAAPANVVSPFGTVADCTKKD